MKAPMGIDWYVFHQMLYAILRKLMIDQFLNTNIPKLPVYVEILLNI